MFKGKKTLNKDQIDTTKIQKKMYLQCWLNYKI